MGPLGEITKEQQTETELANHRVGHHLWFCQTCKSAVLHALLNEPETPVGLLYVKLLAHARMNAQHGLV